MDPHVPPPHACLTSLTPCSRSNSLIRLEQSAGSRNLQAVVVMQNVTAILKLISKLASISIVKFEAIWV